MKKISVLVKPASSVCNIRCRYCFYADVTSNREVQSFGKMKSETTELMIRNIFADLSDGDELTIGFQGGEPTLAGLSYYKHLIECVNQQTKNVNVHYAIQTNGIIINSKWCELFKQNNFLVGLSIDGTPMTHDLNRLDTKGRGTFHRVIQTKKLFDEYKIDYNILCVLTEELSKSPQEVFNFLKNEDIKYVQFIPCLDEINAVKKNSYALTPNGFSSFYRNIFNLWYDELSKGNYISIKLFDDIFNLLVRSEVNACGLIGNCSIQYVIEGDGSVYPCDFFALDEFKLGYIQDMRLKELFFSKISKKFLCSRSIEALPKKCNSCPFFNICRGGCKRMSDVIYVDNINDFCGYQSLLTLFTEKIENILRLLN
ncbi:radical SAM/SPASM domain-containing protein [Enterococcus cecorum]|uniref:Anaerobic sulfatase maturase n=1 Tax=Enterococcus cecorum TaxID=44008 RepID=A0A200I4Q7_9ENTE|nr:SPASM domain-containing protein [Enterococcus cecorum]OUZ19285.1 anaerobic sulfatase maturase [Enterococcus cecorum]